MNGTQFCSTADNDMVTCDFFEIDANVSDGHNPVIEYKLYTDLPAGTQVILSCQRTFQDMRGELSLWIGHNERLIVMASVLGSYNCCRGQVDVVASDKKALALFKEINQSFSPGVKSPVSDTFTLVLTVGARQRLRQFGNKNADMSGQMVSYVGGINIVEIAKPLQSVAQRS
jgi:hypothetical protein